MNYNSLTIKDLKALGHSYLDLYVSIDYKKRGREQAYAKLAEKLKRPARKHHFSEMHTKVEIIEAITTLKKMVQKRKEKNDYYKQSVFLSREKMKEAIAQLRQLQ